MTSNDVLAEVKSLQLPQDSYVVFGSGPMAALHIRPVGDVDLLVSTEVHDKLRQAGWQQLTKGPGDEPLVKGNVEAHDNWNFSPYAPTLEALLSRAFTVDGVPFASIEDVRKWKAASGGAKHEADVQLIDKYLARQREIQEVVVAWKGYLATIGNWQTLITNVEPKVGGCGLVYELPNSINRPNESFAIADMRQLELSEPHKHSNGEVEIYVVLQGSGRITVGAELQELAPGTVIVTPTETVHIVRPGKDLVLAVVNTPPFNADNYTTADKRDPAVAAAIAKLQAA
jgi:mannose-6-phosphate isomerase-like protein (cupin superfamily)